MKVPMAMNDMTQIFQSFRAWPTYLRWNSLEREFESAASLRSTSVRSGGVRNLALRSVSEV